MIERIALPLLALGWLAAALPIGAFDQESVLIAVTATNLSALIILAFSPNITIPKTPLIIIGIMFWIIAAISVAASEVKIISYIYLLLFSCFPIAAITTWTLLSKKTIDLKKLITASAIIASALIINAFTQRIFFEADLKFGLVHIPFANPNAMAGLLSLFFFIILGGLFASENHKIKALFLCLAIGLFTSLIMTGSRGAFLSLIGAFIIFAACLWPQTKHNIRYIAALIIACIIAFISFELIDPHNTVGKNLAYQGVQDAGSLWLRSEIWKAGWQMFLDRPLIGSGIGTFFLYYPEYRMDDFSSGGFAAHNDILQFAIEMGAAAPLIFYAFLGFGLFATIHAVPKASETQRLAIITTFSALSAFIVHTHMTFHFMVPILLITAGMLLGTWLYSLNKALKWNTVITPSALRPVIIIALFLATSFFASLQLANIYARHAGQAKLNGDMIRHANLINAADKISNGLNINSLVFASQLSLASLKTGTLSPDERSQAFDRGLSLLARAEKINRRDPSIFHTRALIYKAIGNRQKAANEMRKFRQLIWQYDSK